MARFAAGTLAEPAEGAATETERRLVSKARLGDGRAFAALVGPHIGLLYRLAARAAGSAALAEDAVQETLEIVHRKLGRYEPGTSFKAFVAAVAVRRARTLLRAEQRRKRREEGMPAPESPATPMEWLAAEQLRQKIRDALVAMPEKRQRIVLLRLDGGLNYAEIAAAVGTTEGSARVLVHHALRDLTALIGELSHRNAAPPAPLPPKGVR